MRFIADETLVKKTLSKQSAQQTATIQNKTQGEKDSEKRHW